MKYVISSSGSAIGKVESLETTLDIMARAGYDTIDFWLHLYSDQPDKPLMQDNWRAWAEYAAGCMKTRGIRPGQCHCQWRRDHAFSDEITLDPPSEIYHRSIEACHSLGCRRLILHAPFYLRRVADKKTRLAILDACVEWFRYLLPTAARFDVELHLENTFDFRHVQQAGDADYPCITGGDMLYMVKKLNHPLVKICIDTGHAHLAAQNIPDMIREVGPFLGSLHLNDNFGVIGPIYEDLHMFPGYGHINWDDVFTALKAINYQGTLNMEPGTPLRNGKNDDHIVKLRAAKALLRTIAERAGFEIRQ